MLSENHNPQINKRRYKRLKINAQVGVLNGKALNFEVASEIGEGGMLIQTKTKLDTGSVIEICMFLPNGRFISAMGQVVYNLEPNGENFAGICFANVKPEIQEEIKNFVNLAGGS